MALPPAAAEQGAGRDLQGLLDQELSQARAALAQRQWNDDEIHTALALEG